MEYLDWLKQYKMTCVITGGRATELHHVRAIGMGRDRKGDDVWHYTAIPVTMEVHRDIHSLSKEKFNQKYGFPGRDLFVYIWEAIHDLNIEYFSEAR